MTAESNKSSTALRALRVLEFIAEQGGTVTVAGVAQDIGADRSTAYRMLMTLMDAGYVARDTGGTNYSLAHKVVWLARSLLSQRDSSALIEAALRELAERTGETVHYSVLQGDAAVLSHKVKGRQRVNVDTTIGERSPLHATSAGKVLLAFGDPALLDTTIAAGLPKRARNTITEAGKLRAELERVRREGFAFDLFEFADDMRCVAAPVFGPDGLDGAISFSGPDSRYTPALLDALKREAMAGAKSLSDRIAGR
jgi:DNA-binding IclR family transcriptional regulator